MFQVPVTALLLSAGQVGRRGHVGARERREIAHKRDTPPPVGHVATVEQYVGTVGERLAPADQLSGIVIQ